MKSAELVFGTVGVNPVQHCLDCATVDGRLVVVHGAAHQLVFREPRVSRAFAALPVPGATPAGGRVNCVRVLDAQHVLCGTSDGRVLLAARTGTAWRFAGARDLAAVLPDAAPHQRSVLCVATSTRCSPAHAPRIVAAATASDCAVVWDLPPVSSAHEEGAAWLETGSPAVLRVPPQRRGYLETCAACVFGTCTRLVALGGTDCRVYIYAASAATTAEKEGYTLVASLAGPQQWVSALAFAPPKCNEDEDGDDDKEEEEETILASGSHDGKMRLWRIRTGTTASPTTPTGVEVILDSVLGGHDDWVTSIKWAGRGCVVTASMDRTVSVWLPERTTDVWTHAVRLWGVPGALLGGSGAGGFYAVAVAPGGGTVLAHGHTGAVHAWTLRPALGSRPALTAAHPPTAVQCALLPAGPTARATTLCWSDVRTPGTPPYLLVGGDDRIVRAYAPCRGDNESQEDDRVWAEIARPLVHGHAVRAICAVGQRHAVAVVSEEKPVRVLTAPATFVKSLHLLCTGSVPPAVLADCEKRPFGAALPALSLSNRPIYDEGDDEDGHDGSVVSGATKTEEKEKEGEEGGENEDDYGADVPSHPAVLRTAPFEEHLVKNTLWPETRKLFGHTAEALCVAAPAHAAGFFVSGCGAFRPSDASVCVWRDGAAAPAPRVTPTRGAVCALCCAPTDSTLFAVAAVDTLAVWRAGSRAADCVRVASLPRLFAAPPTCACWSPVGNYISVTGAPEGAVHIVRLGTQEEDSGDGNDTPLLAPYGTVPPAMPGASASALAWTQRGDGGLVLAVGDTCGGIALWHVGAPSLRATAETTHIGSVPAHSGAVNALAWLAPPAGTSGPHLLASCGDDWCVYVVKVDFE